MQELKEYRRLGIRTMEEAEAYESDMRKVKKQAVGYGPGAGFAGTCPRPSPPFILPLGSP